LEKSDASISTVEDTEVADKPTTFVPIY